MYNMFIEFHISYFPGGRPATDDYRIGVEMVEKYGHELDEQELMDFKKVYQQEVKKADQWIQENQELSKLGITSYKEFQGKNTGVHDKVFFDEGIDLFWELPQREKIIEGMESIEERYADTSIYQSEEKQLRVKEILDSGTMNSIFPAYPVELNFIGISQNIMVTILVSVLFMVSPIFIKDYKNKMVSLQYTSTVGRDLFKWKIAAGLLSAFLITTVQLIVYYSIYSTNEIGMFLNSKINSFMGWGFYWYDFTFLQLIMVTFALTYVLALSMALIAIFVSSVTKNYISIIGIQLPILVIIWHLVVEGYLLSEAFYLFRSQLMVAALYSLIVFPPVIVIFWKWRRERKQDILS